MRFFQGIVFIWAQLYKEIFKGFLGVRFEVGGITLPPV